MMKLLIVFGAMIFVCVKCGSTRRHSLKLLKKEDKPNIVQTELMNDDKTITYQIERYSNDQPKEIIDKAVTDAFFIYQRDYVKDYLEEHGCGFLKFEQLPSGSTDADLTITFIYDQVFKKYSQKDYTSLYSRSKRTMYLNDAHDFSPRLITAIVAHDVGHHLGMRHSYNRDDVMCETSRNYWLTENDLKQLVDNLECLVH